VAGTEPIIAGVAGRYATALFELAKDDNRLDQVETELTTFKSLIDESQDLLRLVKSPAFSIDDKRQALAKVLERAGVSDMTANFLGLVAKNNRLFAVRDMITAFSSLMSAHRGELRAEVTSASELSGEQMDKLAETLKQTLGQEVKIDTSIDPDLLGGLIVKVGSRMIDNSLRTKLNKLRVAMKEVS
jgi:F-type H+-transporting ATPase subunit delta